MRKPTRTLFETDFRCDQRMYREWNPLYSDFIRRIWDDEDSRYFESERAIFDSAQQSENYLYPEFISMVHGPLTLKVEGRVRELSSPRKMMPMPRWVEADGLEFRECSAQGILIVEKSCIAEAIVRSKSWHTHEMVTIAASGLPMAQTRRFVHRLSAQFQLPVYLLADNDTWGYFMFSLLKRGMVAPHERNRFLALPQIRFLGIRAGEFKDSEDLRLMRIGWEPHWELRLQAMQEYRCFQSAPWREEFKAFKKQQGKIEVEAVLWKKCNKNMIRFCNEFIIRRIHEKNWLA